MAHRCWVPDKLQVKSLVIDSHATSSRSPCLASVANVWFNWAWQPLVIHNDRSEALPFQSRAPNQSCCDQGLQWPGKSGFIFKGWLIQSKIWKSWCFTWNVYYECMHCELYHMIARLPVLSDIAWTEKPESLLLLLKKTPTYLLDPTWIVNMPFQSLSTAPSFPLATVESQLPMQRRHQRHLWALAAPMLSTNHTTTGKLPGLPNVAEAKWLPTWEGRYEEITYTSFNINSWTELKQNRRIRTSLWPKRYLAHYASHFGRCCSAVPGDECKLQTPFTQTASPTCIQWYME